MSETKVNSYKWLTLLTVSIGTFMVMLDASIINLSLPRLTEVFNTDSSVILWVSSIFLLASVSLTLSFGKLGDIIGRKRVYVIGMAVFSVGLIACSLSQSIVQLLLSRAIQGVGAAMTLGISVAIVTAAFPDQERGKAVGILGAVISVGHLCGPLLGGLLLDALDWRSIFYTRVPVSIAGLIIAQLLLREQKAPGVRPKFDLWGAATLCGGLTSLLLLVNLGGKSDHVSSTIGILAFCTIALIVLFIVIEKRTDHPIVDLNLFRNTRFASGTGGIMLMFAAVVAMVFLTPFYLINGLGYSASIAGLMMTIHPLTIVIVAPLSGWISDKIGSTLLRTVGTVVFCFALLLLGNLDINSSNLDIALRLIILAVGFGIFDSPNNSSIMGSVSSEHLGTASAMIAASRQVGLAIGTALIGTIFSSRQLFHEFQLAETIADPVMLEKLSVVAGFHDTILVAVIIAALAIAVSLAGIRIRKRRLP